MANITETANLCGLKRENFQTTINGKKTDLYILRNRKGYEVAISNYGGAICAIMVPGKDGKVANVIQGHDSIQQLMSGNEPYLSTLIGRWGNRVHAEWQRLSVGSQRWSQPSAWWCRRLQRQGVGCPSDGSSCIGTASYLFLW